MKFATATNRVFAKINFWTGGEALPRFLANRQVCPTCPKIYFGRQSKRRRAAAFTLVEVLAAMLFMAIVIPVAMEALHIASLAGELSARKSEAARVADKVLNENIATANGNQSGQSGTVMENGHEFHWTLKSQSWPTDSTLQLMTAEVTFSTGGKECLVRLNTLAGSSGTGTMAGLQ